MSKRILRFRSPNRPWNGKGAEEREQTLTTSRSLSCTCCTDKDSPRKTSWCRPRTEARAWLWARRAVLGTWRRTASWWCWRKRRWWRRRSSWSRGDGVPGVHSWLRVGALSSLFSDKKKIVDQCHLRQTNRLRSDGGSEGGMPTGSNQRKSYPFSLLRTKRPATPFSFIMSNRSGGD